MITKIETIEDVENFTRYLTNVEKLCFHPDDDFANYVEVKTGEPTYSVTEAIERNLFMEAAFSVCEQNDRDIYSVMMSAVLKETGLDQLIPLPELEYIA